MEGGREKEKRSEEKKREGRKRVPFIIQWYH